MKKLLALLLALAMCLSLLAGCAQTAEETPAEGDTAETPAEEGAEEAPAEEESSSEESSGEVITLRMQNIWCGADSKTEGWTAIVNGFNEEYAGKYEVILEDQADYDAYVEKMRTLISSGDTPDLFTFKADVRNTYASTGNLMDLTGAVYGTDVEGRYDASVLEDAKYEDGGLYALPYETAIIPLMYNTKLFEAAGAAIPTSYDELYEAGDLLRESGVYPIAQSTGSAAWFSMLYYSYCLASVMGADIYDYAYDSPEWIEATELYTTLTAHSQDDTVGSDTSVTNGHFFNERAAIYCNGTWIVGRIESEGVEGLADSIEVGGTLSYNGENGGGYMSIVQAYIGAAATDDPARQEAVKAFIEYVTRPEEVLPMCQSSGSLFAVNIDTTQLEPGLQTDIMEAASGATFLFDHIQDMMPSTVWSAYQTNVDALLLGEMSAEDFCAALQAASES